MEIAVASLADFEGLVLTTSRMFARQVQREEEDLAQELRVRVWRALEQFDPTSSTWMNRGLEGALKGYVYLAVSNKIRDFKRDAAREKDRRVRFDVDFTHIEDQHRQGVGSSQEWFDALYNFVTRDEVYGDIEREPFECPVELTHREHAVAAMLALGYDRDECAEELGCARTVVNETVAALRKKLNAYR